MFRIPPCTLVRSVTNYKLCNDYYKNVIELLTDDFLHSIDNENITSIVKRIDRVAASYDDFTSYIIDNKIFNGACALISLIACSKEPMMFHKKIKYDDIIELASYSFDIPNSDCTPMFNDFNIVKYAEYLNIDAINLTINNKTKEVYLCVSKRIFDELMKILSFMIKRGLTTSDIFELTKHFSFVLSYYYNVTYHAVPIKIFPIDLRISVMMIAVSLIMFGNNNEIDLSKNTIIESFKNDCHNVGYATLSTKDVENIYSCTDTDYIYNNLKKHCINELSITNYIPTYVESYYTLLQDRLTNVDVMRYRINDLNGIEKLTVSKYDNMNRITYVNNGYCELVDNPFLQSAIKQQELSISNGILTTEDLYSLTQLLIANKQINLIPFYVHIYNVWFNSDCVIIDLPYFYISRYRNSPIINLDNLTYFIKNNDSYNIVLEPVERFINNSTQDTLFLYSSIVSNNNDVGYPYNIVRQRIFSVDIPYYCPSPLSGLISHLCNTCFINKKEDEEFLFDDMIRRFFINERKKDKECGSFDAINDKRQLEYIVGGNLTDEQIKFNEFLTRINNAIIDNESPEIPTNIVIQIINDVNSKIGFNDF